MNAPSPQPQRLFAAVLAMLAIFGGLGLAIALQLRHQWRDEVLRREARAFHAVALMQLDSAEPRLAEFGPEFAIDDLFDAVLKSARLKGVIAVQLFDARGALRQATALAPDDVDSTLWWERPLTSPVARFVRDGTWEMISPKLALENGPGARLPLLEIAVPLPMSGGARSALGVARYWIDGQSVGAEFTAIDRRLLVQAALAALLMGLLAWAFWRLAEAIRRLEAQRTDLARANEELDFAAKTGALGAISAHLIHGLKNPLAGLEGFVADSADGEMPRGDAWRTALETTRRLRGMINEVTTVLRDEAAGDVDHLIPLPEIVEAARQRSLPLAEQAGVELTVTADAGVKLPARAAHLAGLVLANVLANALEATPAGGAVSLAASAVEGGAEFLVTDSGPGLPAEVRRALFRPVRSAKRGGGGVGLAISYRLARHAGGDLAIVRSDARGSVFRLIVPAVVEL